MGMFFMDDTAKVISVGATSKNGVHRLTLTLQYNDPHDMGWDLRKAEELRLAAKTPTRPKRTPRLALPHPDDI